jgi:hypothetical protein
MFPDSFDVLDFAKKFLEERINSLKCDIAICTKNRCPFPALLYCFSTVDLLGALYEGDATGNTRKYGSHVGTTAKAQRYMKEIMRYSPKEVVILQKQFRHKIVHLAQPSSVVYDNNKNVGWLLDLGFHGKHMLIEKLTSTTDVVTLTPYPMVQDHIFIVSIPKFVADIEASVMNIPTGYLQKLIRNEDRLQSKFKAVLEEIYKKS